MKVNIRADSVEIEGYVNAVERASKPFINNKEAILCLMKKEKTC